MGLYLSVDRVVIPTIADGDCGPDAMCLLLHRSRTLRSRQVVRHELAAFLLKHSMNQALIHSMCLLIEVPRNLGACARSRSCFFFSSRKLANAMAMASRLVMQAMVMAPAFLALSWRCDHLAVCRWMPEQCTAKYQER